MTLRACPLFHLRLSTSYSLARRHSTPCFMQLLCRFLDRSNSFFLSVLSALSPRCAGPERALSQLPIPFSDICPQVPAPCTSPHLRYHGKRYAGNCPCNL